MVKLKYLAFGLILILMPACLPQSQDVAELPTLVEFPTETETAIPTDTPPATNTATATHTATSTETATPTDTNTPTATWTRLPSSTPTNTQTFTPTATATPENTPTPLPTRTPDTPVIESFQASSTQANNGDPITLRWSVRAESATLQVLDATGVVIQTLDVNLVGTFSTNTPAIGNVVTFRLIARRGAQEVVSIVTVDMGQTCTFNWFFPNPPSSAGCATTPELSRSVLIQEFDDGFMFRTTVNGSGRVCGIQFDRNLYSCIASSPFTGTPPVTTPAGSFDPDSGLASAFYTGLATGGFWYDIIGFGTTTATTTSVTVQEGSDNRAYYEFPNGIYAFDNNLTGIGAPAVRLGP